MKNQKTSLFSQSLFALPLIEAIDTTAKVGFSAIELACARTHFDIGRDDPAKVAGHIHKIGLEVSALSLFNNFTDAAHLDEQIRKAEAHIRLAPVFKTKILKMTPGPPAFLQSKEEHWQCLGKALNKLTPVAEEIGAKLAFETHMRQLTDNIAGSKRLIEMSKSEVVGLTVDFSNLSFAGEDMNEAFSALGEHMYNNHFKNGTVGLDGSWHFSQLDQGLTDYSLVFSLLRDINYNGYLTIECLDPAANEKPAETAKRDLDILKKYMAL